ncbi:MAG: hypothetical protein IMF19_13580 [Proteobacteria bacterium]|jgi:hypothetical protein|nr:hypothetical protein [Pseudomonadota bacterium]
MERFKLNSLFSGIILAVVVCVGFVLISGCATAPKKGEGPVATLKVCPSAEITTLKYFMKKSKFSGGQKLHVKVGIRNISDKGKRYRVSIFLPDGVSSGGFYPRKGKPPVVKPGTEKMRTFPMYFERVPDSLTVKVEEL